MPNINKKFIIPGVAKRDFSSWKESNAERTALIETTVFLIAWRAQISATLSGQITTSEIQQLPTMRFIARQLSTNYQCKRLAATIAINRTLGFEAQELLSLATTKRPAYLQELVNTLALTKPPRGVKVLTNSQITETTLVTHRLGIMAQLYGLWQSKPLYDPTTVIKAFPASTVDPETLLELIQTLWKELIGTEAAQPTDASFSLVKEYIPTSGHIPPGEDAGEFILSSEGRRANGIASEFHTLTFNDGIVINSSNLFLLEEHLNNGEIPGLIRPIPKPLEAIELPEDDQDPLLQLAIESNKLIINDQIRKAKTKKAVPRTNIAPVTTTSTEPAKASTKRRTPATAKTADNPRKPKKT